MCSFCESAVETLMHVFAVVSSLLPILSLFFDEFLISNFLVDFSSLPFLFPKQNIITHHSAWWTARREGERPELLMHSRELATTFGERPKWHHTRISRTSARGERWGEQAFLFHETWDMKSSGKAFMKTTLSHIIHVFISLSHFSKTI